MVPRFESFLFPFLKGLEDGKEHNMAEMKDFCANFLCLSENDLMELTDSGSTTRANDRTQWARTYLSQAGLISVPKRGMYTITSLGKDLLNSGVTFIDTELLMNYPSFLDFKNRKKTNSKQKGVDKCTQDVQEDTPIEMIEDAYKQLSKSLADDLLSAILEKSPKFFEKLVVRLLVAMGYGGSFKDAASVTQYTHDEGIDGVIKEDRLGLDSIYVQAKRYDNSPVSRKEIQSFVGALSGKGATKGIFITTSNFTKDARQYKPASNIKIVLIDGEQLAQYMIDYNIDVSVKQTFEIKRVDRDFFNEE